MSCEQDFHLLCIHRTRSYDTSCKLVSNNCCAHYLVYYCSEADKRRKAAWLAGFASSNGGQVDIL
jgi:hypothetical protein